MAIRNEIIANQFSPLLREHAYNKLIVRESSMATYIQTVLVPEAAVLLIKEDMNVDVSRAIDILEESRELGDLVHPEDGDDMF